MSIEIIILEEKLLNDDYKIIKTSEYINILFKKISEEKIIWIDRI
jgi:hypothetical protein